MSGEEGGPYADVVRYLDRGVEELARRARAQDRSTWPTPAGPCPSWCEQPAGHGFEYGDVVADQCEREHTRMIGELAFPRVEETGIDRAAIELAVWLTAFEVANAQGEVVRGDPVGIVVAGLDFDTDLQSAEAAQLAALLLKAADAHRQAEAAPGDWLW